MWLVLACTGAPPSTPIPGPDTTEPVPDPAPTCVPVLGPDTCDGVDSDCDGVIDEDPDLRWFADRDGDGWGDPAAAVAACAPPQDHVAAVGDCVDTDPAVFGEPGGVGFVLRSEAESGLQDPHWDGFTRPCFQEDLVGGAAIGDIDADGDLDLFLPRLHAPDVLMVNDSTGVFSALPGFVGDAGASSGALFVDIDGDRDLDLMVVRLGAHPNLLYVNQGAGQFTEEASARGVALTPGGCGDQYGVTAGDVDGDGDLDLLIAGWQEQLLLGLGDRTRLLLNDGTGTFTDETDAWGLGSLRYRAVFGMLLADADRDGQPDLHVVADWNGTGLWTHTGDGFVEALGGVYTDENGMGSDLGDIDADGDLDWFVGSIFDPSPVCPGGWGCTGNRLYRRDAAGFVDATDATGVREGTWTWGAAFLDLDRDADLDLVTTGGFVVSDFIDKAGRAWRNDGAGQFSEATCEVGFDHAGAGRTLIPFDADRDGILDLLLVASVGPATLWMGVGADDRGWLEITLDQPGGNPAGIGAEITVWTTPGAQPQVRLLHANTMYLGGPPPEVHLGLGDHQAPVDRIEVRWPDGGTSVYRGVAAGRVHLTR